MLLLFYATTFQKSMSNNLSEVHCNEKDHQTLLMFKQGVIDSSNKLATWSTEKGCCTWKGVQCDNTTSRVTKLDLSSQALEGELNLSLLELEFLNHLDLSYNIFNVIHIPSFHNNVLSNSKLRYLDLSWNANDDFSIDDLHWLPQLSSLKYLNLTLIDLHKETNWLQLLAMLPSLLELHLSDCKLTNISPYLKYVNFTSLVTLDLSTNNFNSELPHWLFNLSNDISYLDLSWNTLHGEIPSSLFNHQNLKYLDLSHNMFSGSIPSTLGNLTSLVSLFIGSNSFSGAISETHFSKLQNLQHLDLSNSSFGFHFSPEWVPLFQLKTLLLTNTNQGPKFPTWIYTQKSLDELRISSSGISFVDEDRFLSFIVGNYSVLSLYNNSLTVDLSNIKLNANFIKLGHNNFKGRLPHLSPEVGYVDFSYNSFTGSIPHGWENLENLYYINFWGNKLFGEIPVELLNLKQLMVINLGKNEFSGTIPINMSQNLQVVILRSNQFDGSIPPQMFNLSNLIHLDLAHNKLSGSLPQVLYNITAMIASNYSVPYIIMDDFVDENMITFFTKGQVYEYDLDLHRRTIDLSGNNFSGDIPSELFGLIKVQTLNLSYNHLAGTISKTIGGMTHLESLDLSNNKLFGEIPQNMATLSFLEYLNLSCNNFSGQIPIGTQLQSFNVTSYIGNPELCGDPLTKCSTKEKDPGNAIHAEKEDGGSEKESLYLGMGVGFAVGFWGICGSLLLHREWRHKYYRFLNRVFDQVYVIYMVKFNSFLKRKAPAS